MRIYINNDDYEKDVKKKKHHGSRKTPTSRGIFIPYYYYFFWKIFFFLISNLLFNFSISFFGYYLSLLSLRISWRKIDILLTKCGKLFSLPRIYVSALSLALCHSLPFDYYNYENLCDRWPLSLSHPAHAHLNDHHNWPSNRMCLHTLKP